jgi:hypothetical protein
VKKRLPTFAALLATTGFKPTPAQTRMTSVAFDGAASPADDLGLALFGAEVPAGKRDVVAIVKGARIGGSLLSAYRLLHLALTVPLPTLAPGEHAFGLIVAPDLRLARQTLRYVAGALDVPAFAGCSVADATDAITVKRPDGKLVTLECLPATRGGSAVRGRTLVGAVMSEASFFRDENYSVNDAEVYRAIAPRIVDGGQLIAESTPWAEAGLLYDLFTDRYGKPGGTLAVHAPTLLMRPFPKMRAHVEAERKRDPDNAAREFDAAFMTAGSGLFFDPVALDACVDPTIELGAARVGAAHAGADWAFESDSSALAIADATHREDGETQVAILYLDELTPKRGEPLKTSAVVATFAEATKRYGVRSIMADAHYRVAIQEHLEPLGIYLADAPPGQPGKTQTYIRLRELVNAKRVRFPAHDRLLAQLKAIISKPVPGGGLKISSPRRGRSGGHGDVASAVVLAAWQASGSDGMPDYAAVMKKHPHGF